MRFGVNGEWWFRSALMCLVIAKPKFHDCDHIILPLLLAFLFRLH